MIVGFPELIVEAVRIRGIGVLERKLVRLGIEIIELLYARSKVRLEARAAGLSIVIDGAYPNLDDLDGFRADCVRARQMGYTARSAVHPRQVSVIHDVFSVTARQIAKARRVLAAFDEAAARGQGAARLDGHMLDEASRRAAEAVLMHAGVSLEARAAAVKRPKDR